MLDTRCSQQYFAVVYSGRLIALIFNQGWWPWSHIVSLCDGPSKTQTVTQKKPGRFLMSIQL